MAAPAFRSKATKSEAVGGASLVVNKPAGTIEGDLLVAIFSGFDTRGTWAIAGFTSRQSRAEGSAATLQRLEVFTKVAGGAEPSTYAITHSGAGFDEIDGNLIMACYVQAAYDTSSGIADIGTGETDWVAPSLVTSFDNETLIYIAATADTGSKSFTPPTGFTERDEIGDASTSSVVEFADKSQAVAGASGAKTGTLSSAQSANKGGAAVLLGIRSTAVVGGGSGGLAACVTTC